MPKRYINFCLMKQKVRFNCYSFPFYIVMNYITFISVILHNCVVSTNVHW